MALAVRVCVVQDRSDLLKAYLLEIGVIRIRGARRRRNNDDGSPAGGKVDWDSEYVQQVGDGQ